MVSRKANEKCQAIRGGCQASWVTGINKIIRSIGLLGLLGLLGL